MPDKAMLLHAALHWAASRLAEAGVEQPRREARLLAAHVLGKTSGTWLDSEGQIDGGAYAALVARRVGREPLALIIGRRGFWTLDLEVSSDTLVPRPDSETLVEAALAHVPSARRVLDLGTGTGCLLLAVLSACPDASGVGVDVSPAACRLAARNAAAHGLADRCVFLAGDWTAALRGRFDMILCNPPYVETAALAELMPEVRLFEPVRALDGGLDGLDAYRRLLPGFASLLADNGAAVLEIGAGQDAAVRRLAAQAGLVCLASKADLAGISRAMVFARSPSP